MAAESSLILFPRFSCLVGSGEFSSIPVDTSRFSSCQLEAWRGPMIAESATCTFRLWLEESLDGVVWHAVGSGHDPGASKSRLLSHIFNLRWFRVRIKLDQTNGSAPQPLVTCWCAGMLR